jgi:hypothetical protein
VRWGRVRRERASHPRFWRMNSGCSGCITRIAGGERMTTFLLSAILKAGWRLADITPAERALLEQHGFGSGRVQ